MKPVTRVLGTGLVLSFLSVSNLHAQDVAEPEDVAKGAIDPYNPGGERVRFLSAAGVDNELDEQEFNANKAATEPFVRKFDSWATLRAFDKNGNRTIDWFEADGYRRAIRTAVLGGFDANKDGRLDEAERLAANKDLSAGRLPRLELPSREGGSRVVGGDNGGARWERIEWDLDGDGKFSDEERAEYNRKTQERYKQWQEEYTRKWDSNGDGKVDQEEAKVAREESMREWREKNPEAAARYDEQMEQWKKQQEEYVKKWDANGDGQLDGDEHRAALESRMKEWREQNPEAAARHDERMEEARKQREEWTRKWDTDGDGELNNEERSAAYKAQREESQKRWKEYMDKWDADGNGQLDADERKAAQEAAMEEWKKNNPEAYERWQEQQEQWKKQQEERVRRFDKNNDGRLDGDEWREAMKVEQEERQKNGGGNVGPGNLRVLPGGAGGVAPGGAFTPGQPIVIPRRGGNNSQE